jgi:hypothetical protein
MKNEERAKSGQQHLQFRTRRGPNEGIYSFDQLQLASWHYFCIIRAKFDRR